MAVPDPAPLRAVLERAELAVDGADLVPGSYLDLVVTRSDRPYG